MRSQEIDFSPTGRECMEWTTDMRQRALEVIATTRYEWLSRADYFLRGDEYRLPIVGLRICGDDMHKDIHRNCG